jgi:hypothetical protein
VKDVPDHPDTKEKVRWLTFRRECLGLEFVAPPAGAFQIQTLRAIGSARAELVSRRLPAYTRAPSRFKSKRGHAIPSLTLSERAWKHIRDRHPEVSRYEDQVKDTVARPEQILAGKQDERKAIKYLATTHIGPKYLVVVYRQKDANKIIITAYFTSDLKRIKGDVIWKA